MLETNKPYMFGSSTSTQLPSSSTTTTNVITEKPTATKGQGMLYDSYYQGQPTRFNSAFNRHHEEYPNSHFLYNKAPALHRPTSPPIHTTTHFHLPQQIKNENSPRMIQTSALPHYHHSNSSKFIEDHDSSWLDNTKDSGENKKSKRRKEMNTLMEELNQDFLKKKERLYLNKLASVNQELKDAKQDKHAVYLEGVKELERARQKMIDESRLFMKYQQQVTENQFLLEVYQASEEYAAEEQELREKLFNILEEKRRKLKEEKDNCDLAYDTVLESSGRSNKRNLRKRGIEHLENKPNKKKQTTGPAFVFKLKEEEILSDLQAMRNGIIEPSSPSTTISGNNIGTQLKNIGPNSNNKKK